MFVARLLSHRLFLLPLTFVVTVLIAILMYQELVLVLSEHSWALLEQLKEEEESIAILLIGYGVLLEGRQTLLGWANQDESLPSEMTHRCEYYGFVLLALGLFIEIVDQCIAFVPSYEVAIWIELLVNYPMNLYAFYLLFQTLVTLSKVELDTAHSQ